MSDTRQLLRETRDRVAPPRDVFGSLDRRRRHDSNFRRATAAVLGIAVALAGLGGWFAAQGDDNSERTGGRTEGLGIFAPISGWIAYTNNRGYGPGIWAVEPLPSDDPAREGVYGKDGSTPVAWSSDGTELLITRQGATMIKELVILHADGTETAVLSGTDVGDASISPDGRRVVYTSFGLERPPSGLYVVDADGGPSEVLVDSAGTFLVAPTFSPDGTRIAYLDRRGEHQDKHRVWVVNADGSDPHVIVAEATLNHAAVSGLAWSPTGDAIALGLLRTDPRGHVKEASVFTFAPDGSRFTRVIENGVSPTWSPDGSRIAFSRYRRGDIDLRGVIGIVNADGTGLEYVSANAGPGVWHPGP